MEQRLGTDKTLWRIHHVHTTVGYPNVENNLHWSSAIERWTDWFQGCSKFLGPKRWRQLVKESRFKERVYGWLNTRGMYLVKHKEVKHEQLAEVAKYAGLVWLSARGKCRAEPSLDKE